ncbi:hypothetical protein BURCE16_12800 [Burkholderia cepacia]|nr:hypothetical protein BURCE16_12800 [Burkholderia cepacia]
MSIDAHLCPTDTGLLHMPEDVAKLTLVTP